jgi:hypothetical protein
VAVSRHRPSFTTSLEQLVDGKVTLENKVAAILDLADGIEARKVELFALFGGEFRASANRTREDHDRFNTSAVCHAYSTRLP